MTDRPKMKTDGRLQTAARNAMIFIAGWTLSAAGVSAEEPDPQIVKARRERLEFMKATLDRVVLETTDDPPRRMIATEHPVLRYTNPVASAHGDGATFLWLEGPHPAAAVSLSFRDSGDQWWELTSLSDQPLQATRDGARVWAPRTANRKFDRLPDAPAPAESPTARLTQFRALARRFQVESARENQWQTDRLLSQPLLRWSDAEHGVVDGALFGFSEGTDPVLLMTLEVRSDAGTGENHWHYLLGRMTSWPMRVKFDDREIWSVIRYWRNPRSPEDSYLEANLGPYPPAEKSLTP